MRYRVRDERGTVEVPALALERALAMLEHLHDSAHRLGSCRARRGRDRCYILRYVDALRRAASFTNPDTKA